MEVVDIASLGKSVLWATFAITFVLGAVMQKTGFCTMGAVSDIFIMSSWDRLKQWFLAIGIAIIGSTLMSYLGLIDPLKSFYTGNRFLWLSTIIGSILFGFGLDSDALHSPNEHYGLVNYYKGIETIPLFYKYFTQSSSK